MSRGTAAARSATVMIPTASLRAVLEPMPHSASVGRWPSNSNHVSFVIMKTPAGLSGRDLGLELVLADADRAVKAGRLPHGPLDFPGQGDRVVGMRADERLVP